MPKKSQFNKYSEHIVYEHSNQTSNAIEEGGEIVVKEDLHKMPQIFPRVNVRLFNKLSDVGNFFHKALASLSKHEIQWHVLYQNIVCCLQHINYSSQMLEFFWGENLFTRD
jgi:hypothetical protein